MVWYSHLFQNFLRASQKRNLSKNFSDVLEVYYIYVYRYRYVCITFCILSITEEASVLKFSTIITVVNLVVKIYNCKYI